MKADIGLHFIIPVFIWVVSRTAAIDIVYEDLNSPNKSLRSIDSVTIDLSSTTDNDDNDDTTPIPDEPPRDIDDPGFINRTETELFCKENFTLDGNQWAKHCYDDRHCKLYGDCCLDSEFYVEAEQTVDTGGASVYNNSRYGCYATNLSGSMKHALMVGRCPRATWIEPEIREKCENGGGRGDSGATSPATAYPVTGDDTGHTYKNAYCAWCHGERRRVTYWKPVFRCSDVGPDGVRRSARAENVSHNMLFRNGQWYYADYQNRTLLQCELELTPPARAAQPRPCHPAPLIDSCPVDTADEQTRRRCASYAYTVFEDDGKPTPLRSRAFRNADCARCNGVLTTSDLRCTPPMSPVMTTNMITRFTFGSLLSPVQCGPDEAYDVWTDRCHSPLRDDIQPRACWTSTAMGPDEYNARSLDNDTVYVYAYRTRLRYLQRLDVGGALAVCTEYADGPVGEAVPSAYATWIECVGIACSALSAVALLVHLTMFWARVEPRHLPEKNLASLSASLLLGYAGFLTAALGAVDDGPRLPCLLAALSIHFGLLSAFAWMSVMSADVWFVLHSSVKKLRVTTGKRNTRFAVYSAFAWLAPAAFTALAAALQLSVVPVLPELRPNFQRRCWFGNPRSQIALFVVPAGAAILANYVSFVGAVRLVASRRDDFRDSPSVATVNRSRENMRIYVRLSLMMGLAWVFGLVGAVTDNHVVQMVNTVLNGLHGLFIFLAFDCDWTLMRTAFGRQPAAAAATSCSGSDAHVTNCTTGTTSTTSASIPPTQPSA